MNWIVTVQTENSQIIDVPIKGYMHIEDASRAALSITGAEKVLYTKPDYSSDTSSSDTSNSHQTYYVSYDDDDVTLTEGLLLLGAGLGFFASIVSPQLFTLTCILFISAIVHYIIRKVKETLF